MTQLTKRLILCGIAIAGLVFAGKESKELADLKEHLAKVEAQNKLDIERLTAQNVNQSHQLTLAASKAIAAANKENVQNRVANKVGNDAVVDATNTASDQNTSTLEKNTAAVKEGIEAAKKNALLTNQNLEALRIQTNPFRSVPVILGLITLMGTMITSYFGLQTLKVGQSNKTLGEKTAATADKTHALVNSQMTGVLKGIAIALRSNYNSLLKLYEEKATPENLAELATAKQLMEDADRKFEEHEKTQKALNDNDREAQEKLLGETPKK